MSNHPHEPNLPPTSIVIFGGTGDLANTKLLPALLDLFVAGRLPAQFSIIGLSRKEMSDQEYQQFVHESIKQKGHHYDDTIVQGFCERVRYVSGSFDDPASYQKIKVAMQTFDDSIGQCTNKLFYLAVPPQFYDVIFDQLHSNQTLELCAGPDAWARLLVEKPFGRDLVTAQALEKKLGSLFKDEQVYRIDHYLAKDAIENIIALRFVNSILADSWSGASIDSIHIRLLETKDVSNRGAFYDAIGTLRDVGQNHLLQIFALLTMVPADIHDSQAVRTARAGALESLQTASINELTRGQYLGYAEVAGVSDCSQTETYFKLGFTLSDLRWQGTKFTLEAGKALNEQINEVVITFKALNSCHCGYSTESHQHNNVLRIQFSPKERITLSMWTKAPGFSFGLRTQELVLDEHESQTIASPEAYEQVLYDCIMGDQTRFVSSPEVELAWQFITPIIERFQELPLEPYEKGSTGPIDNN